MADAHDTTTPQENTLISSATSQPTRAQELIAIPEWRWEGRPNSESTSDRPTRSPPSSQRPVRRSRPPDRFFQLLFEYFKWWLAFFSRRTAPEVVTRKLAPTAGDTEQGISGPPGISFNGKEVGTLEEDQQVAWTQMRPMINAIVARTPPMQESEFSPTVVLQACSLGASREGMAPSIIISSSSPSYNLQLGRTLERSGLLESGAVHFKVAVEKSPAKLTPLQATRQLGETLSLADNHSGFIYQEEALT